MGMNSKRRVRNGKVERLCLTCQDWFPLAEMAPNAKCADGVRPLCMTCRRLIRAERGYEEARTHRTRKPMTDEQRARKNARLRARSPERKAAESRYRVERYRALRAKGIPWWEIRKDRPMPKRVAEQMRKAG